MIGSHISIEENTVDDIAKDLCIFFNQETVMVTKGEVDVYYLRRDGQMSQIDDLKKELNL